MKVEFLEAGQIVSVHGIRGEVKVLPWADGPEFLTAFSRVRVGGTEYAVEKCRVQKTCNLLKLRGVDTIEAAQALRGKTVEVYRADASQEDVFVAELTGMEVFADGTRIGVLEEVLDYPGNKVYAVRGEKRYLIPAVKAFVLSTDVEGNRMDVRLIEGMEDHAD